MKNPGGKLPYQPPAIRKVKLIREELAVTVCKTRAGTSKPTSGCFRSNCKMVGS